MDGWLQLIGAMFAGPVACILCACALVFLLSRALGGQLAAASAVYRLFGRDRGGLSFLAFLEWLDPSVVAMLLALEADDVAASVLARMRPRFVRKVLSHVSPLRRDSLAYWLEHPQPFPRSEQQAVARRLKRALKQATRTAGV